MAHKLSVEGSKIKKFDRKVTPSVITKNYSGNIYNVADVEVIRLEFDIIH